MLQPNVRTNSIPDLEIGDETDNELASSSDATSISDSEDDQEEWEAELLSEDEQQIETVPRFHDYAFDLTWAPLDMDYWLEETLTSYLARLSQPEQIDDGIFTTPESRRQAASIYTDLNEVASPTDIKARAWFLNRAQQFIRYRREYGAANADNAFGQFLQIHANLGAPITLDTLNAPNSFRMINTLEALTDTMRTAATSPRQLEIAAAFLVDDGLSSSRDTLSEDEGYEAYESDVASGSDDDRSDPSLIADRSPAGSPMRATTESPRSILGRRGRDDFEGDNSQSSDDASRPLTRRRMDSPRDRDSSSL